METARSSMQNCYEYLRDKVGGNGNPLAAEKFRTGLEHALGELAKSAGSFAVCEDEKLVKKNYRRIRLKHYKYKIFFRVIDENVIVDAVGHDYQDVDKLLFSKSK